MTFRRTQPHGGARGRSGGSRPGTRHRTSAQRPAEHDGQGGGTGNPQPHGRPGRGTARREWGQNFFRSAAVARRFARQMDGVDDRAAALIEIGPGSGRVTRELVVPDRPLTAVEIDPHWVRHLRERALPNLTVVNRDFLDWRPPKGPMRFIGNLPFGTGTTMLRRCLELGPDRFLEGVFLLQEEYTRKRVGGYGGNLFNAQWAPWYGFRRGLRFPRHDFRPAPRTDTETLLVSPLPEPLVPWRQRVAYQRFVDGLFNTGQLTVGQAARAVGGRGNAAWLRAAGVPSGLRVKDVTPRQWADLFRASGPPPVGERARGGRGPTPRRAPARRRARRGPSR
ncbi:23S ribosomal RNA methyltransferase Erm [Nocardiopsis sp. EMB25]|uniref:23S ribosomal RNA methyltransferase Erm n=1 Tax=Nocardiopsis sp. EMB25 TaxID=2835867 RepID=UPI0022833EA2|nr:23S ribosomal RNA methyltransferase Erm [Nocardiopsis sp. EMB25]MCY9787291.1 23S ribosomal RNA methyltransferase Erm [Nocardiopsis sp. EMB25]